VRLLRPVLLILLLVPGWTGEERLALPGPDFAMHAERVALDPNRPALRRVGALTYLGGVALRSDDPAFGGLSTLAVSGDRFMLASDGGNILSFRMGADWRPRDARLRPISGGPATGWRKSDRDVEAVAVDATAGRYWAAFENDNSVWRYGPGAAIARARPPAMRSWPVNGGAEAMARLPDGRFVAIAESVRGGAKGTRAGLIFAGDPVEGAPAAAFSYRPRRSYQAADMAVLPDGRLLVLERRFSLPFRWSSRLALIDGVRPGAIVAGRTVALLEPPLLSDNFEGLAVTREGDATIVWLASDNNQMPIQRTYLLKFQLNAKSGGNTAASRRPEG
jgi:hypothetical protein